MDYSKEIQALSNKIIKKQEQLDKDKEKLNELINKQAENNKNINMKNKTFLIFNHPEQIALCYVKDVDGFFIDCDSIFCSDNEIILSFGDRFHIGSLKEVKEIEKEDIKNVLNNKLKIFKENIEKFCSNYGEKEN